MGWRHPNPGRQVLQWDSRPEHPQSRMERQFAVLEPNSPQIRGLSPRMGSVQTHAGAEVAELENREEPRLVRALELVGPGAALREGVTHTAHAHTGALIAIGDHDELSFLLSGGIKLEIDYTPAMVYELA